MLTPRTQRFVIANRLAPQGRQRISIAPKANQQDRQGVIDVIRRADRKPGVYRLPLPRNVVAIVTGTDGRAPCRGGTVFYGQRPLRTLARSLDV